MDGVEIRAELPDLALTMLNARRLNDWLGTAYSLEDVEDMDPLIFTVLDALSQGIETPKKGKR